VGNVGIPELIFIFIIALLVFGPRKLPELGRTLGKALAEFRRASADLRGTIEQEMRELERHAQELEAQASELQAPSEQPTGSSPVASAQAVAEAPRPEEKPADGKPNPA